MLSFLRAPMPPRTSSATHNPVVYEEGRASLAFRNPGSEYLMTHVLPPTSKEHGVSVIQPPFHYHIYQNEFFHVQSGTGRFYRGTSPEPFAILSGDPGAQATASVAAGNYHRFENATTDIPLVVDIHLAPEDYENEQRFFRNFFGYLNDCKRAKEAPSFFQLMVFLESADTPLAVPLPWQWAGRVASRILLFVAAGWGKWVLGYRTSYAEYYEGAKGR